MFAIYKKELRSYFNSFIGFLFIGVTLFFLGLYYTVYNLLNGYPYYSYVISGTSVLFMISIPILCMRILTEERHNKTDQMILTAPVSVGQIVLGKYLALVTIFAVPTLISCLYPLILTRFGTIPMGNAYLAILAFFLYGITSIAICVLISSLTESQVIAAVLSFGTLFIGYMMTSICSLISGSGNLLTKILCIFDLYTPFVDLLNGTLNLDAVVYYISLSAVALFLTTQSIQKRRYSVSVRHFSAGAYSTGMIAVMLAITFVVNVIVSEMPGSWTSLDLTSQKLYSLTDQTQEFVKGMTEDVTIYVIVPESSQDMVVGKTLERYDELSDHITVEYVDPTVNPRFHTQYTDSNISVNSLIVVGEKRSKVIDASDFYEYTYDYEYYTSSVTGYDGEGQITAAIAEVISDNIPKLYITEGHGEYSLSSTFTSGLSKDNIDYETINLMDYEAVPEDAACLLINAPTSDFNADDAKKVIDYLEKGGNVVALTSYSNVSMDNYESILNHMGLNVADGMVIEGNRQNYYQSPFYLLPEMTYDTYTANVYYDYYVFAPFSQGLQITDEEAEGMTYTTFMETSEEAFSKINLTDGSNVSRSEEDIAGPFAIGVKAVKDITVTDSETAGETAAEATLIAISCGEFFTEEASAMVSGANQLVFSSIMGSFSDYETSVFVPVKDYSVSTLVVAQADVVMLGVIVTIVLPVGSLITGFVIWFRRRKR